MTRRMLGAVAVLCAFSGAAAQSPIPIRALAPLEAHTDTLISVLSTVHELSDHAIVVTQRIGGSVLGCAPALTGCHVLADSSILTADRLPARSLTPIAYRGDSMLIADRGSSALLVLDRTGKVVRSMAHPRASDLAVLVSSTIGKAMDPAGRLIYRGIFPVPRAMIPGQPYSPPAQPDSFPLVRVDVESRTVDTLGVVFMPSGIRATATVDNGKLTMTMIRHPLPSTDGWALTSDGSIAIVRGHDYHIDWIDADGTRRSTPKMPFDWRRLTDEDKQRVIDSTTERQTRSRRMLDSVAAAMGRPAPAVLGLETLVPAKELPDYYPPLGPSSVTADRDGNVWILPTTSAAARGGLLYDVVNKEGVIFERVQLPADAALAGFGPGRVVYISMLLEKKRVIARTHVVK